MRNGEISLREAADSLGIALTGEQYSAFTEYLRLLQERNNQFNLVSSAETEEIIWKHFIDSIVIHKLVGNCLSGGKGNNVLDIGTGAGFPGTPLKIMFSEIKLTMIEATKKKVDFLQEVVEKLMLDNVSIVWGRSEEYGQQPFYREKFDIVVSRAVAELNTLVELTLPFAKVGGIFIAYKGPKANEELIKAKRAMEELGGEPEETINMDLNGYSRSFVLVRKKQISPPKYPRKAGIPQKRPL